MELSNTEYGVVDIQTEMKQFEGYTKQEVEESKLSRELQRMVGHPTERKYKDMARETLLPNCPITTNDATNAKYMFGTNLSNMRLKTAKKKPSRVDTE